MSFGSFEGEGIPRLNAEINTTPLVDVMLVLLVVFILTAPLLAQGIKINLPQASATPLVNQEQPIRLSITADGGLHWNDSPLSPAQLMTTLTEVCSRPTQPEIRIYADEATPYRHLARVLAAAQQAGLTRLSFVTTAEASPPVGENGHVERTN